MYSLIAHTPLRQLVVRHAPTLVGALAIAEMFYKWHSPGFDENTMACAERWAAEIGGPAYAIDDQTAIQVVDGEATVITEGNWRYFGG